MKREPEDLLESSPYHGSMVHGAGYTKLIFSYARLIYVCRNTAAAKSDSPQLFYLFKVEILFIFLFGLEG